VGLFKLRDMSEKKHKSINSPVHVAVTCQFCHMWRECMCIGVSDTCRLHVGYMSVTDLDVAVQHAAGVNVSDALYHLRDERAHSSLRQPVNVAICNRHVTDM
jgi:hypothetical protein